MKRWHVLSLIVALILLVTGFSGFISNWFAGVSGHEINSGMMLVFWLSGTIGMLAYIILLILALVSIFDQRQSAPHLVCPSAPPVNGQIIFSIILLFMAGPLSSALILYALSNAVSAKYASSEEAGKKLKIARNFNITAVIVAVLQYAAIGGLIVLAVKKFLNFGS